MSKRLFGLDNYPLIDKKSDKFITLLKLTDMESLWSVWTDVSFVKTPLAGTAEVSYILYNVETPKYIALYHRLILVAALL